MPLCLLHFNVIDHVPDSFLSSWPTIIAGAGAINNAIPPR
jgi:hypothetical protein